MAVDPKYLIKKVLPRFLYAWMIPAYRCFTANRESVRVRSLLQQYKTAKRLLQPRGRSFSLQRLLLVPTDDEHLLLSQGDDAMISTAIVMARQRNPEVDVDVVVGGVVAATCARKRGLNPVPMWHQRNYLFALAKLINERRYDAAVVIGGDSLDGCSTPLRSAKIVLSAALSGHAGVPTTIPGFSVSTKPHPNIGAAFDKIGDSVSLNVRDEISLGRFKRISEAKARLVADSAFLFQSGEMDEETARWFNERRAGKVRVFAFNLHPTILNDVVSQYDVMIDNAAKALADLADQFGIHWLLVPHDYTEIGSAHYGDVTTLQAIYRKISIHLGDGVCLLEGRRTAGELKAIMGAMDGVITARMHMAIAALSMGTPAMSASYYGKFEGLYRHFPLPDWLLLPTGAFDDLNRLKDAMARFIREADTIRADIATRLPAVVEKARANYAIFEAFELAERGD